jgi:hypothetical protein
VKKKWTRFKILRSVYHFSGQFDLTYCDLSLGINEQTDFTLGQLFWVGAINFWQSDI